MSSSISSPPPPPPPESSPLIIESQHSSTVQLSASTSHSPSSHAVIFEDTATEEEQGEGEEIIYNCPKDGSDHGSDKDDRSEYYACRNETTNKSLHDHSFAYYPPQPPPMSHSRRDDRDDKDDHHRYDKNEDGNAAYNKDDNDFQYCHDRFELVIVAAATSLEDDDDNNCDSYDESGPLESTTMKKTKTVVVVDPPSSGTIQHVQNEQEQQPTATVGEPASSSTIDQSENDLEEDQGEQQEQAQDEDHRAVCSSVINTTRTKEDPDGLVFNDSHENEHADQNEADSGGHQEGCDGDDDDQHFIANSDSNNDNHDTLYCHLSSEDFCNYFDGNDDDHDNDREQKRPDDPDGAACAAVVVAAVATSVGNNVAADPAATVVDETKFVNGSYGYHNDDVEAHDDGEYQEELDCDGNSGIDDYYHDENCRDEEGEEEGQDYDNEIKPEQKEGKDGSTRSRTKNANQKDDDEDTDDPEQQLSREEGRHSTRSTWTMAFSTIMLCLELAVAMIALIFHDDIVECCDQSIFSRNEETADRWNKAMFGIAIGYVCLVVVEIPIVVFLEEPFFLFNPMIGFLLTIHMMYLTNTGQAYVMFGLETAAMLAQSIILIHMERNAEVCLHAIFNYTICGLVVYILIDLTREGGYCIVDGELQTVFQESTCNMLCTDDETCFVCDIDSMNGQMTGVTNSSCFISFPSTGWFS